MFFESLKHPCWFMPKVIRLRLGSQQEPGNVLPRNNGMVYSDGKETLYQDEQGRQWRVRLEAVEAMEGESETKEKKKKGK